MSRLVAIITILAVLISWEPLVAVPPVTSSATPPLAEEVQAVHDIELKSGHFFRGQLPGDAFPQSRQGVWVRFFKENRLIAETRTDRQGRFTLRYLPTGTGVLAVSEGQVTKACFCRLWAPGTAPQKPDPGLNTPTTTLQSRASTPPLIARAQGFHVFPVMSFKQVATVVGVVGGAIAVPVIWHNIEQDHKSPVSGS